MHIIPISRLLCMIFAGDAWQEWSSIVFEVSVEFFDGRYMLQRIQDVNTLNALDVHQLVRMAACFLSILAKEWD